MDRAELQKALVAERVRPDAYDLTARGKNEAYVLREEPFGWSVFYSERGLERDAQTFVSEAEACEYLFTKLRNDPTPR